MYLKQWIHLYNKTNKQKDSPYCNAYKMDTQPAMHSLFRSRMPQDTPGEDLHFTECTLPVLNIVFLTYPLKQTEYRTPCLSKNSKAMCVFVYV